MMEMSDKIEPTVEEYAEAIRRYQRDGGPSNGFEPDHVGHIDGAETVDDLEVTNELFAEAQRARGNPEAAARLLGEDLDDEDEDEDDGELSDLFGGDSNTADDDTPDDVQGGHSEYTYRRSRVPGGGGRLVKISHGEFMWASIRGLADGVFNNGDLRPEHLDHIEGVETVDDVEYMGMCLGDLGGGSGDTGSDTVDDPDADSPWADKNRHVAEILSIAWPGLGHVYLGGDATGRGLGLLVYSVLSLILISVAIGVPMYIIGAAFAYFDVRSLIASGEGVSSEAEP